MSGKRLAANSALWSAVLQWSRFGLNTIVFLVLARMLTLEEIGAFAVAFACVRIFQVMQRSGFVEAVTVDVDASDGFLNTFFWVSIAFGCVAAGALFGASFVIDAAMRSESVGEHLAAMSVIPLLLGLSMISEGLLLRSLRLRALALRSMASLSVAGAIAVWMGLEGYGSWSLTAFAIVNMGLASLWSVVAAGWVPTGAPRREMLRRGAPTVVGVSGRNLANAFVIPMLQIITGAFLGPAAAGAFQIAQRFLTLAETMAISPMRYVALPLFSRVRHDRDRLCRAVLDALGMLCVLSMPVYFGLLAVADRLLPVVVGEANAQPSIALLRAMLLIGGTAAAIAISNQALTAVGKPSIAFRRALLTLAINAAAGLAAAQHSALFVCLSYAAISYVTLPLLFLPVLRALEVPPRQALGSILAPLSSAIVMAAAVVFTGRMLEGRFDNAIIILGAEIAVGVIVYVGLTLVISRRVVLLIRGRVWDLRGRASP